MKNFKYLVFAGLFMSILLVNAQVDGALGYYNDALTFGQTSTLTGSSARMQGLAGTQTSLGADMSSAGSNPAGLGFFNRSVVSFTPSVEFNNSDATFMGGTLTNYKNNFNFANLGVVFNSNKGDFTDEKFKGGSFAITLQRTNTFNSEVTYQGNGNSSIIDSFLEDAGTQDYNTLGGYTFSAYENYLITPEYDGNGNVIGYYSDVPGLPTQQETITTSGSQYALNFAWGGNYDDKVYFGASLGFVSVDYMNKRNYRESDFIYQDGNGNDQFFDLINYINVKDELRIEGNGVKGNFGMIVRPVSFVTLGVSYQTPTYYNLEEQFSFTNDTYWGDTYYETESDTVYLGDLGPYVSDVNFSNYNLRTPGIISLGGSVFLGKYGFISGDVDFVDYTSGHLKSSDFSMTADNQSINGLYTNTVNYRLGAEFRLDHFRFRGGFAHTGDPYKNNPNFDASRQAITFGVGYRSRDFFVDMALVNRRSKNAYSPYNLSEGQPVVDIENRNATVSATVGFNF